MPYLTRIISIVLIITAKTNAATFFTVNNFTDNAVWTTSTSNSGSAVIVSSLTSSTATIAKSGPAGGTRLTISLASLASISTLGYENITLGFTLTSASTLEWDATLTNTVNGADGFLIFGDGVNINAGAINDLTGTTAETEIANGAVQSATQGSLNSTSATQADFTFNPSVDNSSITDLEIILQINANSESLTLSNLTFSGDPIPEPSSTLLLICSGSGLLLRRKR